MKSEAMLLFASERLDSHWWSSTAPTKHHSLYYLSSYEWWPTYFLQVPTYSCPPIPNQILSSTCSGKMSQLQIRAVTAARSDVTLQHIPK